MCSLVFMDHLFGSNLNLNLITYMKNPIISVIFPVFNGSAFLRKSINSILNQTFTNFELIIINDGSTDNTLDIISEFKDERITVLNEFNQGMVSALIKGISISRGEYIARMDHDDICTKSRFKLQLDYLLNNPEISVVSGAVNFIDEYDNYLFRTFPPTSNYAIKNYLLKFGCVIVHPAVMFRKKDYIKIGGYNLITGNKFNDYHLWLKFVRHGYKIANLKSVILNYRLLDSSITSQFILNATTLKLLIDALMVDNPDKKKILHIENICKKTKNNVNTRLKKINNIENKIFNNLHFLGSNFLEHTICNLKNIYSLFKLNINKT